MIQSNRAIYDAFVNSLKEIDQMKLKKQKARMSRDVV